MYVKDGVVLHSPRRPVSGKESRGGSSKEPARVRVEFPETWLWSESRAGYPSDASSCQYCDVRLVKLVHMPEFSPSIYTRMTEVFASKFLL